MKKSYLMIAAAVIAMASCTKESIVTDIDVNETTAITFEQFMNKATRAEIKDKEALAAAGGFKVWGYKTKTASSDWTKASGVFTGTTVTGNASGDTWTYTGTKYWDKTSTYRFYAAGPVDHNVGTLSLVASGDDYVFEVKGAKSALAADSKSDFVIDRTKATEDGSTHTPNNNNAVSFDFHHIMAKLSFAAKKSADLASSDAVKLTSMKMTGYNAASGDFKQTKKDGTWGVLDCSEWTISGTASGDSGELAGNQTLTITATDLAKDYIMVPQQIASGDLKFTVSYTINGEAFTDQEATISGDKIWGTDSHTTYTMTIGPAAIKFDVTSVCDFCVAASGDAVFY